MPRTQAIFWSLVFLVAFVPGWGCAVRPETPRPAPVTAAPGSPGHAALFREGLVHQQAGRHERAATSFRLALQEHYRSGTYHFHLACCHATLGRLDEALMGFHEAARLEPELAPKAFYNQGTLLLRQNRAREAIEPLERSAGLVPDARTFVNLGKAYFTAGEPGKAVSAYEQALQEDPGSRSALEALARIALAAGTTEAAESYLRRLEEEGQNDLARSLRAGGRRGG